MHTSGHGIQLNQDTKMLHLYYSFILQPHVEVYADGNPLMTVEAACQQQPCVDYQLEHIMVSLHNLTMAMRNTSSIHFKLSWPIPLKRRKKYYHSCTIEELDGTYNTKQSEWDHEYNILSVHIRRCMHMRG